MRICIVALSGFLPAQTGGPATVAHFLAKEFARKGHEVVALVRTSDREEESLLSRLSRSDEFRRLTLQPLRANYESLRGAVPGYIPYKVAETALRFCALDSDAVIYNSPPIDAGILLPPVARLKKTRQVAIVHGGLFLEFGPLRRAMFTMHGRSFDALVTVSRFMKDVLIGHGFPEKLIHVIPNGVDIPSIRKGPAATLAGYPKILFVGRLAPIKDVPTLLGAFSRFAEGFPEARLYVVGDGPESSALRRMAAHRGLQGKAHFTGIVRPPELYGYYRACDIFVLPSLRESFGLVLLEAMAAGLPVVAASEQGGVAEQIADGVNGFLFPAGNPEALDAVLRRIWMAREESRAVAGRALDWAASNFAWSSVAEQYLALLESV